MSISNELRDVNIRYECPSCHSPIVKTGSWFKAVSIFRCDDCKTKLRLGYSAKLALFQRHRKSA
ncbi:hypothetical protein FJ957_04895 [Mesorhizobium sp. B2-4-6]|nr:hypothetical protein FJW10_27010 [Mesorhizobium sp. B4-1-1]TPL54919.1 hypothetical protein FJ957_04895 [Mesorhizobium sp. B2-4-6]